MKTSAHHTLANIRMRVQDGNNQPQLYRRSKAPICRRYLGGLRDGKHQRY